MSLSKQTDLHANNADGGWMVVDTHIHLDFVMTLPLCDVKQSGIRIEKLPAGNYNDDSECYNTGTRFCKLSGFAVNLSLKQRNICGSGEDADMTEQKQNLCTRLHLNHQGYMT